MITSLFGVDLIGKRNYWHLGRRELMITSHNSYFFDNGLSTQVLEKWFYSIFKTIKYLKTPMLYQFFVHIILSLFSLIKFDSTYYGT